LTSDARRWIAFAAVASACHRAEPAPATATTASAVASAPATASASASAAPLEPTAFDAGVFENQFTYGGFDAGAGDPDRLRTRPGYVRYDNARFGFSLDVPRALDAMPEPTNGDGLQWRLGALVAMTASGMNYLPEIAEPFVCKRSPAVTGCRATKTSLWITGKSGGYVFWERTVVSNGVQYSLRLQYVESLKSAMDPIVTHVNASWSHG